MADRAEERAAEAGGEETDCCFAVHPIEHSCALEPRRSSRRTVALDGLGVGRVGAHVDALVPRALERVAHVEAHAADPVDLEVHDLAVLQRTQPLVVGAAGDEVAGVQGHDARGELDQLGHQVLHVVGVVVVAELAVDPELHVDVVGVGDLVERGDAGADGREGVERLAEPAPGLPGPPALAARGDVDHAGVAEHRAAPVLGRTFLAGPFITSASSASCMKIHGSVNSGSTIVSSGPITASGFLRNMFSARASSAPCSQ